MSIDSSVKLLDALTHFISVLIWPVALVWFFLKFAPSLRSLFEKLAELSFKLPSVKASVKINVVAALNATTVQK